MPFYAHFPATVAACTCVYTRIRMRGRGVRGIRGREYIPRDIEKKRERDNEKEKLYSRWSLVFEARKGSRDGEHRRLSRREAEKV